MRWIHIAIVVLFAAATLIFLVQNREIVSMVFLGFSVRAPLAVIAASFYVLGAITGGSAYALLRRSVQGARATPPRNA
jgi:putative membrane protein